MKLKAILIILMLMAAFSAFAQTLPVQSYEAKRT